MKVFACVRCGVPVSRPVEAGEPSGEKDGDPFVPAGRFVELKDEYGPKFAGFIAIHLDDAAETGHFPDGRGLFGCCGPDALSPPNTVCSNGHEIGTEISECYTLHALLLDPSRVKAR